MGDGAPNQVERWQLLEWVNDCLTDAQLTLSPRQRWIKVLLHERMDLTSTQTLVALTMAGFMAPDGTLRISLTRLAGASKLSRRAVSDAVQALIRVGFLEYKQGGPGRSNRYRGQYPEHDPRLPIGQDVPYRNEVPGIGQDVPHIGQDVPTGRAGAAPVVDLEVPSEEGKKSADAPPAPNGASQDQDQGPVPLGAGEDWLDDWWAKHHAQDRTEETTETPEQMRERLRSEGCTEETIAFLVKRQGAA